MKEEDLNQFIDSIKEKVGEEVTATIADDLGKIITANTEVRNTLEEKNNEITRLNGINEKLVTANGALLQQIPSGKKEEPKVENPKPEYFDYHSAFDKNGNVL